MHASTSLLVTADLEVSFSLSAEINVPEKVLITCLGWEAGLGKGKDKSVVGRERNGGGGRIFACWIFKTIIPP